MGRHSKDETASDHDTRAGGNKLGAHEKGFSDKEMSDDMLDRLAEEQGRTNPRPMGDLSSMDEGH